ncbi:phage protein Gp27 family protein [Psychrobacter sp. KH172YL61]|uniref:phage protein Gp27 family protein n=1 Tax=Psychrobacter sp. KH172YL61 TaxID=2517899 RepID=UPI0022B7BE89|nr:phage protein Gp27 family protein [Psychrobacter sp. KH172YL61]
MARESAVDQLSPEHLELLKVRLEDSGFQDYQQLTDWLTELGYQISKSSVHRFGKSMSKRCKPCHCLRKPPSIWLSAILMMRERYRLPLLP